MALFASLTPGFKTNQGQSKKEIMLMKTTDVSIYVTFLNHPLIVVFSQALS